MTDYEDDSSCRPGVHKCKLCNAPEVVLAIYNDLEPIVREVLSASSCGSPPYSFVEKDRAKKKKITTTNESTKSVGKDNGGLFLPMIIESGAGATPMKEIFLKSSSISDSFLTLLKRQGHRFLSVDPYSTRADVLRKKGEEFITKSPKGSVIFGKFSIHHLCGGSESALLGLVRRSTGSSVVRYAFSHKSRLFGDDAFNTLFFKKYQIPHVSPSRVLDVPNVAIPKSWFLHFLREKIWSHLPRYSDAEIAFLCDRVRRRTLEITLLFHFKVSVIVYDRDTRMAMDESGEGVVEDGTKNEITGKMMGSSS